MSYISVLAFKQKSIHKFVGLFLFTLVELKINKCKLQIKEKKRQLLKCIGMT